MSFEHRKHHVLFPHLKYDVKLINNKLAKDRQLDCFMFLPYFNVEHNGQVTFELKSYPHANTIGSTQGYNEYFCDPSSPDTLDRYEDHVTDIQTSVILAPNAISKENMLKLITSSSGSVDFLIFIPKVNEEGILIYVVNKARFDDGKIILIGDDPYNTNPSPPATIESIGGHSG